MTVKPVKDVSNYTSNVNFRDLDTDSKARAKIVVAKDGNNWSSSSLGTGIGYTTPELKTWGTSKNINVIRQQFITIYNKIIFYASLILHS